MLGYQIKLAEAYYEYIIFVNNDIEEEANV